MTFGPWSRFSHGRRPDDNRGRGADALVDMDVLFGGIVALALGMLTVSWLSNHRD